MTGRAIERAKATCPPPATDPSATTEPSRANEVSEPTFPTPATASEQAITASEPRDHPPALDLIRTLGRLLDDLERLRIQNANRVGALERERGEALPHLHAISEPLAVAEHQAELELVRAWRKHPLAPWAKDILGVGEKTIARLISEVGDPGERPNVAKLWAYCGLGDPARKRRKGMTQDEAFALGNPNAKKRCWILGEAFVKTRSGPYRTAYDVARVRYSDRVHATACVRCGPAGKPAAPGSPWSLKHQHEAAKRYAVKQFLKDLWIASRQEPHDPQPRAAGDSVTGQSAHETQFAVAGEHS